jgi:hypothetical protein
MCNTPGSLQCLKVDGNQAKNDRYWSKMCVLLFAKSENVMFFALFAFNKILLGAKYMGFLKLSGNLKKESNED